MSLKNTLSLGFDEFGMFAASKLEIRTSLPLSNKPLAHFPCCFQNGWALKSQSLNKKNHIFSQQILMTVLGLLYEADSSNTIKVSYQINQLLN